MNRQLEIVYERQEAESELREEARLQRIAVSGRASQVIRSPADELAKLATLRDQGVLSTSEFETMKAKLLARTE